MLAVGQLKCFSLLFLKNLLLSSDVFLPSQHPFPTLAASPLAFHHTAVSIGTHGRAANGLERKQQRPPVMFPTMAAALPCSLLIPLDTSGWDRQVQGWDSALRCGGHPHPTEVIP